MLQGETPCHLESVRVPGHTHDTLTDAVDVASTARLHEHLEPFSVGGEAWGVATIATQRYRRRYTSHPAPNDIGLEGDDLGDPHDPVPINFHRGNRQFTASTHQDGNRCFDFHRLEPNCSSRM